MTAQDGLPVQCVGPWAETKHHYVGRYIDATRGVRAKYLQPTRGRTAGGAAFVDLFAGPGRARLRDSGEEICGSPVLALAHESAPFTKVILADIDAENVSALSTRTAEHGSRVRIFEGDCNDRIQDIVAEIPPHGLNIALVDPFGLRALAFDTLRLLASVKRMDLVIHFPTMDIKRNFQNLGEDMTRFIGTDLWRTVYTRPSEINALLELFRGQLEQFGYARGDVRSLPVKNTKQGVLYHLVYATKHSTGNKIWKGISGKAPSGQRDWNF